MKKCRLYAAFFVSVTSKLKSIFTSQTTYSVKFYYVLIFFSLALIGKAQQPSDPKKSWEQLKPGMSDIDVKRTIGEPQKIESFATVKTNTFDTSVYWRYPNGKIVVITNHLFERVEKNREELLRSIQQHTSKNKGLKIVTYGKE